MQNQEAVAAKEAGMAKAEKHVSVVDPAWMQQAYDAFVAFAKANQQFTVEQLRKHLHGQGFRDPPTQRCWGVVSRRASTDGIVSHAGWTTAEDPKVHQNVIRIWRSTVWAA